MASPSNSRGSTDEWEPMSIVVSKEGRFVAITVAALRQSEFLFGLIGSTPKRMVRVDLETAYLEKCIEWCEHHKSDTPGTRLFARGDEEWQQWDRQFIDKFIEKFGMLDVYNLYDAAVLLGIPGLKDASTKVFAEQMEIARTCPTTHYYKIRTTQKNNQLTKEKGTVLLMSPLALFQSDTLLHEVRKHFISPEIPTPKQMQIPVDVVDTMVMKCVIEWCEHHKFDEPGQGMHFSKEKNGCTVWPAWEEEFMENFIDNFGISQVRVLYQAAHYLQIHGLKQATSRIAADYLARIIEDKNKVNKILGYQMSSQFHDYLKGLKSPA